MTSSSRIAALPAAAMATFALAGCGADKATLATFTGTWQGHGRTLNITRTGNAKEWISLGLGHFVIALQFHLSRLRGTPHDAIAAATVTAVRLGKRWLDVALKPRFEVALRVPDLGHSPAACHWPVRMQDESLGAPLWSSELREHAVDHLFRSTSKLSSHQHGHLRSSLKVHPG